MAVLVILHRKVLLSLWAHQLKILAKSITSFFIAGVAFYCSHMSQQSWFVFQFHQGQYLGEDIKIGNGCFDHLRVFGGQEEKLGGVEREVHIQFIGHFAHFFQTS